jgi:hypothetical protein
LWGRDRAGGQANRSDRILAAARQTFNIVQAHEAANAHDGELPPLKQAIAAELEIGIIARVAVRRFGVALMLP